ncbi:MAG: GNAT family N-acetyltransferase [Kineosporiaceae bacterium]
MATTRVGPLTVELSTDVAAFSARAAALLAADPVRSCVVASWVERTLNDDPPVRPTWLLVTSADSAGSPIGAAMHTPPFPPYLPPMPEAAAAALADALHQCGDAPAGVNGDAAATAAFVERWVALTGCVATRTTAEGVHVLDGLAPPVGVDGAQRAATHEDLALVLRWYEDFGDEIGVHRPPLPRPWVRTTVERGLVLLWTDPFGAVVSLAGRTTAVGGVSRIGPVYTPPAQRRHGYAAAVTAGSCRQALAAGAQQVMLFTDLANPTSNGVYARLGFRRVGDASEWLFEPSGPG